jgi:hypothetical protein
MNVESAEIAEIDMLGGLGVPLFSPLSLVHTKSSRAIT